MNIVLYQHPRIEDVAFDPDLEAIEALDDGEELTISRVADLLGVRRSDVTALIEQRVLGSEVNDAGRTVVSARALKRFAAKLEAVHLVESDEPPPGDEDEQAPKARKKATATKTENPHKAAEDEAEDEQAKDSGDDLVLLAPARVAAQLVGRLFSGKLAAGADTDDDAGENEKPGTRNPRMFRLRLPGGKK